MNSRDITFYQVVRCWFGGRQILAADREGIGFFARAALVSLSRQVEILTDEGVSVTGLGSLREGF